MRADKRINVFASLFKKKRLFFFEEKAQKTFGHLGLFAC